MKDKGDTSQLPSLKWFLPDKLNEQGNLIVNSGYDKIYAIMAEDKHNSLKEGKASYDWPEWQYTIDIEHEQLL